MFNNSGDPQSFVWFLNWWPYSILHGLNPFITNYVWYPSGFNLTWATSIPTAALIMAPVTLLWGALVSFNILALLAPALSALTCFYLVYYLTKGYLPSLFSGYIFGFSSYELGQLLGHTNLYLTFLIPLLILVFLLRLNHRIGKVTFILLTSLMLAAEFGISTEIFATFILFSLISILVFYLFANKTLRSRLIATTKELVFAMGLFVIIVSPYLYYLLKGYTGAAPNSAVLFSADILNFIVPTPVTLVGHTAFRHIAGNFTGNFSEEGAYLGIPFLSLLIYVFVRYWRKYYIKALAIIFFTIAIFSLGPRLHINGAVKGFPLPWALATHLPLIKSALPIRLSMYLFLVLALLLGFWLSQKVSRKFLFTKYAIALASIVFILPNLGANSWQKVSYPKIFNKQVVANYISPGSNVLILPFSYQGNSMYYQYTSGMEFRQAGGYVGAMPKKYSSLLLVASLLNETTDPHFKADLYKFCRMYDVAKIIYTPSITLYLKGELGLLHWNTVVIGNTTIISVPSST